MPAAPGLSPGSMSTTTLFGGMTGYGFEVPQGDPGAIESAAQGVKRIGGAFAEQATSLGVAAQVAVGADGGWHGAASGAFAEYVGRFARTLRANAEVCDGAAGALAQLSRALSHAQAVTRQALADCDTYNDAHTKALGDVQTATVAHQTAVQNEQTATDPLSKTAYGVQASQTHTDLVNAQSAVHTAETNLTDAKSRGVTAFNTYMQEASALAGRVNHASAELHTVQSPPGGAPAPLNVTPADTSLASKLMSMWLAGRTKGPLIDAVPADERTPGLIYSLMSDQRTQYDKSLQAGGARGPYTLWSSYWFGNWTPSINAAVRAGVLPPMPANWSQLSSSGSGEQYWQAMSRYDSGITCEGGACNLMKVTGTGTASVKQVIGNLARLSEWGSIAVCTVGSDGACIGAVKFAFGADTAANVTQASSFGNFLAREGVTTGEVVVVGVPGLVKAEMGAAGSLEGLLPESTLGKVGVNTFLTGPSAGITAVSPQLNQQVFPNHPKHHHGHK